MVPAAFTWMDDLERWLGRKLGHRFVNDAASGAAPAQAAPSGAQADPV
jgi:hypothetical protein